MKVSIVLPLYNQSQYVGEAIESCLSQTLKPHEIIVVNDGSTDDWEEAIFPYLEDITILHQTNQGLSSARNTGIKASTGDYCVCLDSDDKLPPEYLEQLSKIDADVVGCGYKTFGDYEKEWKTRGDITLDDLIDGNRTQCSALFKREVWDKTGGFDERMKHGHEDWEYWIHAVLKGFTMKTTDKTYLLYRKHGETMVSKNPEYSKENQLYIFNKHKSGFQARLPEC
jgi:glycosyltransferase involved in cell wall biosynthesis